MPFIIHCYNKVDNVHLLILYANSAGSVYRPQIYLTACQDPEGKSYESFSFFRVLTKEGDFLKIKKAIFFGFDAKTWGKLTFFRSKISKNEYFLKSSHTIFIPYKRNILAQYRGIWANITQSHNFFLLF